MKMYDISPPISKKTAVWPGDTPFSSRQVMSMREGDSVDVATITTTVHIGAHTDAPSHFADAESIDEVSLDKYIGPATVVEVNCDEKIEVKNIEHVDFDKIKRVLFRTTKAYDSTKWSENFIYPSKELAEFLATKNVVLVGIDSPSMDHVTSKDLPIHKTLLKHGIAILEGIDLTGVPEGDYELIALPLKLKGLDSSPVRAILRR